MDARSIRWYCVFETDSLAVLYLIYGQQRCPSALCATLNKCWNLLARFDHWKFRAINREANALADLVASYASFSRQRWLRLEASLVVQGWCFSSSLVCLRFFFISKKKRIATRFSFYPHIVKFKLLLGMNRKWEVGIEMLQKWEPKLVSSFYHLLQLNTFSFFFFSFHL